MEPNVQLLIDCQKIAKKVFDAFVVELKEMRFAYTLRGRQITVSISQNQLATLRELCQDSGIPDPSPVR